MPRRGRSIAGGMVYHVLNRAVGKIKMLGRDSDRIAFERVMHQAYQRHPLPILGYCIMPSHWHFVVAPERDSQVTEFFRWLTHTHAMRWRFAHNTVGYGPLYQGRFKSFPVQDDQHLLTLLRYVERNPLAAGLVPQAERWQWSSLWARSNGDEAQKSILSQWPIDRPRDWNLRVNQPLAESDLAQIKTSVDRGTPFGSGAWIEKTVAKLNLQHTIRKAGRPAKMREA